VSRVENYQGTFIGPETIDAGGSQVATLVYEWRSTFTGDGQRNTSTGITVRHVIVE
jgi:hypothetical protein